MFKVPRREFNMTNKDMLIDFDLKRRELLAETDETKLKLKRAELEDIMDLLTSDFQITKQELVELASFTAHIKRAADSG